MSSKTTLKPTANRPSPATPPTGVECPVQAPAKEATAPKPAAPSTTLDAEYAAALALPVSHYEKKSREIHQAMWDIYEHGYTFTEVAEYYGYTPEALGVAFATVGIQAMQIARERNVYQHTAYRAMALNNDGYNIEMQHALPKAFWQKKEEAEMRAGLARVADRVALNKAKARVMAHKEKGNARALPNRSSGVRDGRTGTVKLPQPQLPGSEC